MAEYLNIFTRVIGRAYQDVRVSISIHVPSGGHRRPRAVARRRPQELEICITKVVQSAPLQRAGREQEVGRASSRACFALVRRPDEQITLPVIVNISRHREAPTREVTRLLTD